MSYTCPYCFTPVNPQDIWFQCSVPTCAQPDEVRTRFDNDLQPQQPLPPGTKLVNYNTVFQGKNPAGGVCPKCQRSTTIHVCPNCHTSFPAGFEKMSNAVFAIVGGASTGKSHYIAVLINQLKKLYNKFNWSLCALSDDTMETYRKIYYEPLFMSNISIKKTTGAQGNQDQDLRKPLLYSLEWHGKNSQSCVVAFFDSAGEDLQSQSNMAKVNRYIASASGILLLLDPLQIASLRHKVHSSDMPKENNIHYQNQIIELLHNLIAAERRRETRSIPLAITFSKIDLLGSFFGEEFSRFNDPIHHPKGILNLDELQANSDFIRLHLENEGAECIQAHQRFDASFFGVSALGKDPIEKNGGRSIPGGPQPMHVEDPFLWLLHKNGFIQGK